MSKHKTPAELEAEADRLLAQEDRLIASAANDKYKVVATKISPERARLLEAICKQEGTTSYDVIQMLLESYIRFKDPGTIISEEMKRLMIAFGVSVHMEDRLNLTDPSVKVEVQEMTVFLGDPSKKGEILRHIYHPFMGEAEMTDNPKEILERTMEEFPVLYPKLRKLCKLKRADSIYELLVRICEEHDGIEDANEIEETFSDCERSEFGKRMEEIRYKRTQINSMEAFERRQTSLDFPEWTSDDQINETF